MKTILAAALILHTGLLGAQIAGSPGVEIPEKYVLQFSDDFKGDQVDTNQWTFRTDAKALSTQLARNVSVHDGKLYITPRKEDVADMHYTGGGIISKAAFRYGYFEVTAQVTNDPGWHTSFWAMAGDGKTTFTDISRTEIDDFEIESPLKVSMGYLVWKNRQSMSSERCNAAFSPGFSTASGMHTYAVEWTETSLTYYLDRKKICQQTYLPTQGTHDRVNIWLTTIGAKQPIDASGTSPAVYSQVRYYVRDYYIDATEPGYAEYGKDWHDGPEPGFSSSLTRASCSGDATAMYVPSIVQSGSYNVQAWHVKNNPALRNGAGEAHILSKAGLSTKEIPADTATGWVDLGTYDFERGTTGSVTLAPKEGCLEANMVKFLRR
ncbi:family 16 glycosylhydrolase [Terriglobus sp. 2YAB30_2]|uniref:family 16 glycosylhydrolase n=1 Tax=Terriglobus sp. 2YAB30_2 TaxID=3233023 RepID=UPI003F970C19